VGRDTLTQSIKLIRWIYRPATSIVVQSYTVITVVSVKLSNTCTL